MEGEKCGRLLEGPSVLFEGLPPTPPPPPPQDCPRSFLSQCLTCSEEENQAVNIIPCFLGAAPQFLIMEEGSDTLSFSPFSPFDHKPKQNSLKVWT